MEGGGGSIDLSGPLPKHNGHVNADLGRQYESGLAYSKESKREGLGA